MKQNIIILLVVAFTTTLVAQTDSLIKKNSFQLSFGQNQTKEKNINAKVHSGASFLLTYIREKEKKNLIRYNMSVLFSKLKTKYENASRSMNIQLKGDYGYFFNLKKTEKYKLYTGPNLSANYRLNFYPNWDESHLYWADDFSLGLSNHLHYHISGSKSLRLGFNISVLSIFSRPPLYRNYKIDDVSVGGIIKNMNSDFQFGTVNNALNIYFQSEYQFKISNKISQAIAYTFYYGAFRGEESLPFQNTLHNLSFKIYY